MYSGSNPDGASKQKPSAAAEGFRVFGRLRCRTELTDRGAHLAGAAAALRARFLRLL